jgi:hypothetical protein
LRRYTLAPPLPPLPPVDKEVEAEKEAEAAGDK